MTYDKADVIEYRISRAKETLDDAKLLAHNEKWNSAINRLYYAAFYAVSALLLNENINASSHNGTKSKLSEHFIITGKLSKDLGKVYSQLFTWRQKGDYDDLFDFDEQKVMPYFKPVEKLIEEIALLITN